MEDQNGNPIKSIKLSFVLSWIFGLLLVIAGLSQLIPAPVTGVLSLMLALVILPPVNSYFSSKYNFTLSWGLKTGLVSVLVILIGISMPSSSEIQDISSSSLPVLNTEEGTATTSASSDNENTKANVPQPAAKSSAPVTSPKSDERQTEMVASDISFSQKNAVRKAQSYLNYSAFSRDGLIEQLEFEQFSHADAVYGVDNSGANWNEQAAKKAKSYLKLSAFSRGSLITQLEFDKFTSTQAEYGVNAAGL